MSEDTQQYKDANHKKFVLRRSLENFILKDINGTTIKEKSLRTVEYKISVMDFHGRMRSISFQMGDIHPDYLYFEQLAMNRLSVLPFVNNYVTTDDGTILLYMFGSKSKDRMKLIYDTLVETWDIAVLEIKRLQTKKGKTKKCTQ